MKHSRLFTALNEGLVISGPVHVIRPPAAHDLAGMTNISVEATFFPDHQYWSAMGVLGDGADRAATLVILPRSKTLARQMVSEYFRCDHQGAWPVVLVFRRKGAKLANDREIPRRVRDRCGCVFRSKD